MVGVQVVRPLGDAVRDANRYGGKAAGLGRLISLGHRVPQGFAIAVDVLLYVVEELGAGSEYRELEASMSRGEPDLACAERIRSVLDAGGVPAEVMEVVADAVAALGDGTLIVRSSAAAEDSAAHSYAGIFESIPVAATGVAEGIKTVWGSVFSPRALAYAAHAELGHVPRMGVVVQRFIDADRSGVMFTTFPGPDGGADTLVEHVSGTAEKLVKGEVTPSRMWLRSQTSGASGLEPAHVAELARLAQVLEEQFDGPQDVEWCIVDAEVHVVQTRPVTAVGVVPVRGTVPDELVRLRGTAASPGVGCGPVHLAFNVDQALALESGAVLVTPMTNPDMVVAMRNSAAIVTDVGGMICHAAIVSRELQLPCVVGTGTATETLQRGDVVTVDGGHGVVLDGEIDLAREEMQPATAADLWGLWTRVDRQGAVPMVATLELLEAKPAEQRHVIYLIDNDIRCDERGLWAAFEPTQSGSILAAQLRRLASSLPGSTHVDVITRGAVSSADLQHHVSELNDSRIAAPRELVIAWEGASGDGDEGVVAIPIVSLAAAEADHRHALGPVEQSIARSLDPAQGPGPVPRIEPGPMPDPAWRRRWWERLAEYGRFHHEFQTARDDGTYPWIEIRPEVLTSPLLKSLVQPGFEMVPRALGFTATPPMHTKWARCRFHVRADAFGPTWGQLVQGTWDPEFMEHFLAQVRASYDQMAEIVQLFPSSDIEAAELDDGQLIALVTAWWPRWVEFFALCLFIQAQGEAVLYPVIAETVEANLADLGPAPPGLAWPTLPDLIAPTTPVLSGEYMASVGAIRSMLDAAGLDEADVALRAVERRDPPELAAAMEQHLAAWHWMRDRDLLFEPWDTAERVIATALRTDPHPAVPYEENLRRNKLALAFHADLAEAGGRGNTLRHGVRFLQDLNVERENHHLLWLRFSYPLRRVVLEMERRLIGARSHLEPGMIFYLQCPELLDAIAALPNPLSDDLCALAGERRRAYRHEAQLEPSSDAVYREDDYY